MSDKPHYAMLLKLCAYYNQTMSVDGTDVLHPKVEMAKEYVLKVPAERLKDFYDKLLSESEFFPTKIHLSNVFNSMFRYSDPVPDRIGPDHQLTEDGAAQNYAEVNGVVLDCPPENQHLNDDDFMRDYKVLAPRDLERKYGFKRCRAMLYEIGKNRTDEEWEQYLSERMDRIVAKERGGFYRNDLDDDKVVAASELFHK